jgi:hypothetical protein
VSDYAGGNADRDAFFAALGRVFQEFRDVSKGYGVCDVARLAEMVGGDLENQVGISRAEGGKIVTEFFDKSPNLPPPDPPPEPLPPPPQPPPPLHCILLIWDYSTTPPSWECYVYETPEPI